MIKFKLLGFEPDIEAKLQKVMHTWKTLFLISMILTQHLVTESTSERRTIWPDPFLRLVIGWFQVFCILIGLEKDQASLEQN